MTVETVHDFGRPPEPGRYWTDESWYPPFDPDTDGAPRPGWWLATDGQWYPPETAPTALGRYYAALAAAEARQHHQQTRIVVLAAVLLIASAVVGIARASTSPHSPATPVSAYLADVKPSAVGPFLKRLGNQQAVSLGLGACADLGTSPPAQVEVRLLAKAKRSALPVSDAVTVIRAAATHLCPAHRAQVTRWALNTEPSPSPHRPAGSAVR